MKTDLQIGQYRIRLHEHEDHPCFLWPILPFVPFLVQSNGPPDLDFKVTVTKHLPELPQCEARAKTSDPKPGTRHSAG